MKNRKIRGLNSRRAHCWYTILQLYPPQTSPLLCVWTAKMLVLAQDEVAQEEIQNAWQMTLERWFGGHASE